MQATITARQATHDACDFTLRAWRGAWGVQAVFALGLGLLFVSRLAGMPSEDAANLASVGWAVTLTATAPLAAALLRIRLGGAAPRELGPAGLQFGMAELRLVIATAAWAVAAVLVWLPMVAVSAAVFIVLGGAGSVDPPLLGPVRLCFLVAGGAWIAAAVAFVYAAVRLTLGGPATVGRGRLVLLDAWSLGAGRTGVLLGALLATAAPLCMTLAVVLLLDRLASLGGMMLPVDAILASGVFACVLSFVQAPLTAGVLGAVYADAVGGAAQPDPLREPVQPLLAPAEG